MKRSMTTGSDIRMRLRANTGSMIATTVRLIIFKDINFHGFSKFILAKNFLGKNFKVLDNQQNFYC